MTLRSLLFVAAAVFAFGGSARSQDAEEFIDEGAIANEQPGQPPGDAAPGGAVTPRLAQLRKLEFDRRPSAILAAWSTPLKDEKETEEDAAKEKEAENKAEQPAETKPAEPTPDSATPNSATPPAAQPPEDPEAAKKAAEAEAAKKKQEEEARKKAAEAKAAAKALDKELATFRRNVTLGEWPTVKTYLAGLEKEEQKAGYERMLQSLAQDPPPPPNVPDGGRQHLEKHRISPADVIGLAEAAPQELTKEQMAKLGALLRRALAAGHRVEGFITLLAGKVDDPSHPLFRRRLAVVLAGANELVAMGEFLPSLEKATESNDREAINLLARHDLAQYATKSEVVWLERAWEAIQHVLAEGEVKDDTKTEAITRAVEIAPKIRKELGQAWLDESFTKRPERGMEIVAAIGSASARALPMKPSDSDGRLKLLELQTTAAKALLAAAPERATEWTRELGLLADNWLHEAQLTYELDDSGSLNPRMQRDRYGNFYYWNRSYGGRNDEPTPIATAEILETRPNDEWIAHLDATLRPRFQILFAQLLLKVGEDAAAFPYIETIAATLPVPAKELVGEFLRVWTRNHDPDSDRERSNPYIYYYGFDERASGIPLTRSKQERNLKELGDWIARLRKLPVEIEDHEIAAAFTTAHSSAEIFRLELIEQIFGPIKELKPSTLAELVETMRANLVSVWRDPALQEKKKTNRHQQDIQAEVTRGYELAGATVDGALAEHADSWELWLVRAAIEHDLNNFRQQLGKDPEFSARRAAALGTFRKAADLYAAAVETLDQEKESVKVYETWFYAALGACDLKAIDHEHALASAQIPLIRDAIAALPGPRAERHLGMFASALFTRMSSAAPAVKFRYVREGLAIVGDHKLAREAREVYDYYKDLVTEIQLRASIDGDDRIALGQPFGLRVDLRHTREIERESGGFAKYLQNQNAMSFSYNYGRPPEDYRDKFEEAARETLKEHFDVLSVTFNDPQVKSKADPEYGWRVTPYAYLLLQPRGPQVDRIPSLRLDLDFLDTSGYAILPVESATLPIDANPATAEDRPYTSLALTQTLDERQAKEGKLILEVKANAVGLVPRLESILEVAPEGFDVVQRDDHGVAVVKFDDAADAIDSERSWTLTMRAKDGLASLPESFTFGTPRVETVTAEQYRYLDADLASVAPTISLERQYGTPDRTWMWTLPVGLVVAAGAFVCWRKRRRPAVVAPGRYKIPDRVTPFTVLGLLREIEQHDGLAPSEKSELVAQIEQLERHFFGDAQAQAPDLQRIAEGWVTRSR